MLGVNLGEAENLGVREPPPVLSLQTMQIVYLLRRECQSLLLIIGLQILHILDRLRLYVDCEDILMESFIHTLQHGIVVGILTVRRKKFLDTTDALQPHILGDFHGIGRPRGHHLPSRAYEIAVHAFSLHQRSLAVEPLQLIHLLFTHVVIDLSCNHRPL